MSETMITSSRQSLSIGEAPACRLGLSTRKLTGPGCWGAPRDTDQAIQLLRNAVDAGVAYIDAADAYGPSIVEDLIRTALHPYPQHIIIATKGGLTRQGPRLWAPCGRPEYLRQCVEMSLRRLRTENIPLYYLHRIDPAVPLHDQLAVLSDMQAEGKIGHIGLCTADEKHIREASELVTVAAVQHKYNVANIIYEPLLRYCESRNIAFVPYSPLSAGRLAQRDGIFGAVADTYRVTPSQLALAWLLHRSPVVTPIPGTSSVEHLRENLAAVQIDLSPDDLTKISAAIGGKFDTSLV